MRSNNIGIAPFKPLPAMGRHILMVTGITTMMEEPSHDFSNDDDDADDENDDSRGSARTTMMDFPTVAARASEAVLQSSDVGGGVGGGDGGEAVVRALVRELQRQCARRSGDDNHNNSWEVDDPRKDASASSGIVEDKEEHVKDDNDDDRAVELLEYALSARTSRRIMTARMNVHLVETLEQCQMSLSSRNTKGAFVLPSMDQIVFLCFEQDAIVLFHDDRDHDQLLLSESDRRTVRRLVVGDWRDRVSRVRIVDRPLSLTGAAGAGDANNDKMTMMTVEATPLTSKTGATAATTSDVEIRPPHSSTLHELPPLSRHKRRFNDGGGYGYGTRCHPRVPTFICHGYDIDSIRRVAQLLARRAAANVASTSAHT